jgi:elongation factor Ts
MANISLSQIQELRNKTGVGMMTCKKALTDANGDLEQAVDILRKKGAAKAAEKSDRSTGEGLVVVSGRTILTILCETDFVARNEKFIKLANEIVEKAEKEGADSATAFFESIKTDKMQEIGENIVLQKLERVEGGDVLGSYVHTNNKVGAIVVLDGGDENMARDVAMHAVAMNPSVANPEEVPAEEINKEKEIYLEQLKAEGKPEQIIDKIIAGKVKKFCADRALASQMFVKDPKITVAEFLGKAKLVKFVRATV